MTARRCAIENFCRLYLSGEHGEVETFRKIYKDSIAVLTSKINVDGNVEDAIHYVGQELFDSRPAKLAHVMVFLEFMTQIHLKVDKLSHIDTIRLATDVIEKSSFNPMQHRHGLLHYFLTSCMKIVSFIADAFH